MNNKGQFKLIGLGIGIIIALALILLFLFSEKYRLIIGGVALLGLAIWAVLKYGSKKVKTFTILTMFIAGLLLIFVLPQVGQSIFSTSKVYVGEDGKPYWLLTASANKPGESYVFTYSPKEYTSNGLTTTPKESLILVINPKEPTCKYQAQKVSQAIRHLGIRVGTLDYYLVNNPEKSINVEFTDGNYNTKTLDGTSVSSVEIKDNDGSGSVVIETQGLLSGKYNCPDNDNLAIYRNNDGSYSYLYKNELDTYIESANYASLFSLVTFRSGIEKLNTNTLFTNSFEKSVTFDGNKAEGIINFGYPVFTITADADYFNSVYYQEPKLTEPLIRSVNVPSEILADRSSSGSVSIENSGNEGTVYMQITSSTYSISGYQSNFNLGNSKTTYFTIKAPNQETSGNIDIKVCPTSQFTSVKCDTESVNIKTTIDEKIIKEYCGDGICQSNENYNICQKDCKTQQEICDNNIDDDLDGKTDLDDTDCKIELCGFGQTYLTTTKEVGKGIFGIGKLVGLTETQTSGKCVTSDWVIYLIASVTIIILGSVALLTNKQKKKIK